jgi:hypothetical protein
MIKEQITIQRELGEHDEEIGIFEEPNGDIVLTIAQADGANKNSLAAQIAKTLIDIATDSRMITINNTDITSNQSETFH